MKGVLDSFFVHYKTSLAGIVGAALVQFSQGTNLKSALLSAAIAALGLFAKDGDK